MKQMVKKFYYLAKKEGIIRAGRIIGAKTAYNLTKKREIDKLRNNRPDIVPGRYVFCSNPDYSDNARVLCEYLVKEGYLKDHEIIWLVGDPDKFRKYQKPNLIFVREKYKNSGLRTPEAFMYVWTAEKVFFTHSMRWAKDTERLPGQQFINLWHGCGYKSAKGKSENIHFDYVLVPGEVFIDTKTEFFQCDREKILPIGYPRYDLMLSKTEKGKKYINKFRKINGGREKVVLWMPTYRLSHNQALSERTLTSELNLPIIENMTDLNELNEVCKKNGVVLILKRHQLQTSYAIKQEFSHIKYLEDSDLEKEDVQLYEALSWVDALITDYSSVAIDYMLLDKPIGFTLDDYQQYKDSRGFVFEEPLKYMPGMHMYNKEDFSRFIEIIGRGEDHWRESRSEIIGKTHNPPKQGYCKRIAEYFHI